MITHMNRWDTVDLNFQKVFDNVITEERFYLEGNWHQLRSEELSGSDMTDLP